MRDSEIVEILKKEDEEYRKFDKEHRSLEERLAEIDKKKYLTSGEEVERKSIQKQKLARKDKMAEIVREYKNKLKV
ncbi:MAG: DUF465 domain-containing protein [Nitrospirae bacterium]|nr:DUF465 domain-containing protein [Nitrospirota bacterium]